jgi:CysZ protein
MSIPGSLLYGAANVFHPRMLWLMLWPMLVSVALWGTLAFLLWTRLALWIAGLLQHGLDSVGFLMGFNLSDATLIAANVLLFLLFVPLVYLTALFILGLFGMQQMVNYVASRSFPALERRRGGGIAGSVWNAFFTLVGMVGLGVLSLPLWLIPPFWPLIPVAILSWVNQRLLRYDALAEHADAREMASLFRRRRGALYALGGLLALAAYVPIAGFFAPVVFGLGFIHYLLGALASLRAPIDPMRTKNWIEGNGTP